MSETTKEAITETGKFIISDVKGFIKDLTLFKTLVNTKATIPVLECIRLKSVSDGIELTGTDLDNSLSITSNKCSITGGESILHLQTLINTLKGAETAELTIARKDIEGVNSENKPYLHSDYTCHIETNLHAVEVEAVNPEQFPELPEFLEKDFSKTISFESDIFLELLNKTSFSATKEQSKFTIHAAALEFGKDGFRTIATDGYRLAVVQTKDFIEEKAKEAKSNREHILISLDAIKVLTRIIKEPVSISIEENHIVFSSGNYKLTSRKPSGRFPRYRMIFRDDEHKHHLRFNSAELKAVLEIAVKNGKYIRFEPYENYLTIKGSSDFSGGVICDFPRQNACLIGFTTSYLLDICKLFRQSEVLSLSYTETEQPCLIEYSNELVDCQFLIQLISLDKDANLLTDTEKEQIEKENYHFSEIVPTKTKRRRPVKKRSGITGHSLKTLRRVSEISEHLNKLEQLFKVNLLPKGFQMSFNDRAEKIREIVSDVEFEIEVIK